MVALAYSQRLGATARPFLEPACDRYATQIVHSGHSRVAEGPTQQILVAIRLTAETVAAGLKPIVLLYCRLIVEHGQARRALMKGDVQPMVGPSRLNGDVERTRQAYLASRSDVADRTAYEQSTHAFSILDAGLEYPSALGHVAKDNFVRERFNSLHDTWPRSTCRISFIDQIKVGICATNRMIVASVNDDATMTVALQ